MRQKISRAISCVNMAFRSLFLSITMYEVISAAASRTDVIFVSGDIQRIVFRIVGLELYTDSDISTKYFKPPHLCYQHDKCVILWMEVEF
jgi:hypothetical protein